MIVIFLVLSILLLLMGIIFVLISRTAKLGVILIIISSILGLMMPIFVDWFLSPYYGFDFAIGLVFLTPFILLQFFYTFEYSHFRAKDFQEASVIESQKSAHNKLERMQKIGMMRSLGVKEKRGIGLKPVLKIERTK